MTLAEITHPEETASQPVKTNVIGFRRVEELMENRLFCKTYKAPPNWEWSFILSKGVLYI